MPRCCFALFATAKKTRLAYDSLGGKYKGEGKTAVDSPSLYQHKGKLIALSSLPCPAPILSLWVYLLPPACCTRQADPFFVTLQAIQKHFRNRKKYFSIAWLIVLILPSGITTCSNFSLALTCDIKNISPLDQRKISTGGKSRRTLKKRTLKPENFKKERPVNTT